MTARSRSKFIDPPIAEYALEHSSGPDAVQLALQRVTAERTGRAAGMQIGDDQAVLLEILARATGARRAVEVGTFTGYSSLALARGMGPDGRLLCLDISQEWTAIAREHWEQAGVADRIELIIGPARRDRERVGGLSAEEQKLWRLVADGLDTTEISRALLVSERTAKRRVSALLHKLRVASRLQAAALAGRCGLLDPE